MDPARACEALLEVWRARTLGMILICWQTRLPVLLFPLIRGLGSAQCVPLSEETADYGAHLAGIPGIAYGSLRRDAGVVGTGMYRARMSRHQPLASRRE